jgi:hypothetical protein
VGRVLKLLFGLNGSTLILEKAASHREHRDHRGKTNGCNESTINRDFPLEKKTVIPAKAGIQFIEKRLRSRSTLVPCPLRGLFFLLDSRLRGNDGSNGKSGINRLGEASKKQNSFALSVNSVARTSVYRLIASAKIQSLTAKFFYAVTKVWS